MGRGEGKGGCDIASEADWPQLLLCCVCFVLATGPVLVVIGAVLLAGRDDPRGVQMSAVSTQVHPWLNDSNPSGRTAFMAATFQAVLSFPLCGQASCQLQAPGGGTTCNDSTCNCFTRTIPLEGVSTLTDVYRGASAGDFSFPQFKFTGVLRDALVLSYAMVPDMSCWPRIDVMQRDSAKAGNWSAIALVSPKAGVAAWDPSRIAKGCPSPAGPNDDLSQCVKNCDRKGSELDLFNNKPFCFSGTSPDVLISGTCTKLMRTSNASTLWQKDWVSGAAGCGCFYRDPSLEVLYTPARVIEQDLVVHPAQVVKDAPLLSPAQPPAAPPTAPPGETGTPPPPPPPPPPPDSPPPVPTSELPTFTITLRSAQDPWIVFQDVTGGRGRFLPTGSAYTISVVLTSVGACITLLWCIVVYYSIKVWSVRGRFQYKTDGFVTGFKRGEVEAYGRLVTYGRLPEAGLPVTQAQAVVVDAWAMPQPSLMAGYDPGSTSAAAGVTGTPLQINAPSGTAAASLLAIVGRGAAGLAAEGTGFRPPLLAMALSRSAPEVGDAGGHAQSVAEIGPRQHTSEE